MGEILRPNEAGDEDNLPNIAGDGVGTHYTVVDEETITTSYAGYSKVWATNPNTGLAWT